MTDLSDQLTRRELLAFHTDTISRMVMNSDSGDPVGFIIDATDRFRGMLGRDLIASFEQLTLEQAEANSPTCVKSTRRKSRR